MYTAFGELAQSYFMNTNGILPTGMNMNVSALNLGVFLHTSTLVTPGMESSP